MREMIAMKFWFILPSVVALVGCQLEEPKAFEASRGLSEAEFAKVTLNNLQAISFANNREFCGYILRTPDGVLAATQAKKGRISSCRPDNPT